MPLPNVVATAVLQCTFGTAPSTLVVVPKGPPVTIEGRPAATVTDMAPMVNVPPFAMCIAPTNPTVIAATAAALGVFTPMPCVPAPTGPWKPGALQTKVNNLPVLTAGSICNCAWQGVITVVSPGTTTTLSG